MKRFGVLGIKFRMKSIKLRIIWNLFLSMLAAFVLTLTVFIGVFAMIQLISQDWYAKLLKLCNASNVSMLVTGSIIMLVYLSCTILIFTYRLNEITDYIKKISDNIHLLAQGDFGEKLVVESSDELGALAGDINRMSEQIDTYINNEKKWNEERYHIITNISHDLKTPIMSIQGYVRRIKDKGYQKEDEFTDYCTIILKKSEELSRAINQLFELSKLNSNGYSLHKYRIRLKEFTEQVVVSYIPLLEEKNMDVRIGIASDIEVIFDPELMKRVFENIISNTIKYASSGKCLDIKGERQNSNIAIHFINYGPQIPEQDIEHVFDRYYREKKNDENEGNGLGLTIAHTIMKLHGGAISVDSDALKTDFTLYFPV